MSDTRLDVYLLGEPQPGIDRPTLVRNLATTFKKDVPVIEKMLRRPRSLLKANVDAATAAKYQSAIKKAGGQCELVNHGEQLFPSEALSPVAARAPLSVAPIEPTALTPAVDDQAPAADNIPHGNAHYQSPYSAPTTNSESTDYFCYKCGRGIAPGLAQCPYCRAPQVQLHRKEKATAGVLAFFLGGLGVHRFYLGQWWGIFYLLFWGTLIPSIVSLIEAFVFWFTPNERWNQKYGQVPARGAGMAVALVIGAILMVAIVGILAAVALPAYQDYTTRSKVQAALPLINETRQKVTAVIKQKNFLPSENVLAGLPETINNEFVTSIELIEDAKMVVSFRIPHLIQNGTNTIIWTPEIKGDDVVWTCLEGSLSDKYRMPECRGGSGAVESSRSQSADKTSLNARMYSDDKTISLMVPNDWKGNRKLNEEAILGVANTYDEVYAIVIRESKTDFESSVTLDDYLQLVVKNTESSAENFREISTVQSLNIKGLSARQQVIAASVNRLKVTYLLTGLEDDTHFYLIYAWTMDSRFEKNRALLKKVSESFTVHAGVNQ
ncbi:NINE protein [Cellvibrio sp. UBA7671]|uniref:NINE protein n=1 Tax=Cellvibrio sp. UBA7671 TaxID=1946312 RepID=UPI002F35308C